MSQLAIQPMQWMKALDINEVPPLNDKDMQCFQEIRAVLKRHDALDRFGLTLIHKHFHIDEDELMVEFTDHEARTLIVKPIKCASIDENFVTATNWKLTENDAVAERTCVCARTSNGHTGGHASI